MAKNGLDKWFAQKWVDIGSKKGKIPTTPKEKSLAKLAPPRDRITFGDVVAGRTKGKA